VAARANNEDCWINDRLVVIGFCFVYFTANFKKSANSLKLSVPM
jgi:hypothetical protein